MDTSAEALTDGRAPDSSRTTPVKSAERALAVIEHVAARGTAGFTDVLESLDLPRSSAHGLLRTLVAAGWLEKGPDRCFTLGLRAWEVGQQYGGHRELVDVARPLLDRASAELGETVQMARLDGAENVYIAISHSPRPFRLASAVGMRLPAHATGIGKALLSLLPEDDARRRLEAGALERMTARTTTDRDELLRVVGRARELGYATDEEEYALGCVCVATPVGRDSQRGGTPVALSVTMPTSRVRQPWPESYVSTLAQVAAEIRAATGLSR